MTNAEIYLTGAGIGFVLGCVAFLVWERPSRSDLAFEVGAGMVGVGILFAAFWFVAVPAVFARFALQGIGFAARSIMGKEE